jgi:hypothetical protein
MKIPLLRSPRLRVLSDYSSRAVAWVRSVPFAKSSRGVLLHRVRFGVTFLRGGDWSHDHVDFWCGNGANHGHRDNRVEFFESPPGEYLVCERCEEMCRRHGEKSSSELAGRHVHVGRMVAKRACCDGSEN